MIVDENVWGSVMHSADPAWLIIRQSLRGQRAASSENNKLHAGGTYWKDKVNASPEFKKFIIALSGSGRVQMVNDNRVDAAMKKWQSCKVLTCDTDHWALALAEVAPTKLMISDDVALKADFRQHLKGKTISKGHLDSVRRLQYVLSQFR